MITPLADRDTLDVAGLERLVERLLEGGVAGLFVLGTNGEGPSLSGALRREVIDRVCSLASGRVPILVGVTDTSMTESVRLARHAAAAGARAVVFSAPYYFSLSQQELLDYSRRLVAELPLPAFLYSIPVCTRVPFGLDAIRELMDLPGVVGIKDSSGDLAHFGRVVEVARRERPDWTLLMGHEALLAEAVLRGADGGVCGGANLDPRLFVELHQAAQRRDWRRVSELNARLTRLAQTVFAVSHPEASFLRGLKCALSCLGVCGDAMAPPFQSLSPSERAVVQRHLLDLGYLDAASPPSTAGDTEEMDRIDRITN
ncbi:MAG: dihydrodipicolinate synthase family protein [Pirellulales bacterium]|nr:dihydrodipicolinate synthase family protein [Pirellulales bacterium]